MMTHADSTDSTANAASSGTAKSTLFDLAGMNLTANVLVRADIEKLLPHRHEFSMLDAIAWHDPGWMRSVGVKHLRADDFWCRGHFPGKPTFPGVLMIETAAQLSAYAFLARIQKPSIVLFLRIEDAAFRAAMAPGDTLYILCQEQKSGRRRFITKVQGLIGGRDGTLSGKIAFDAVLNGMMVENDAY